MNIPENLKIDANLIGGAWRTPNESGVIAVANPATGEIIGNVPKFGAQETKEAIDAAYGAFPAFSALDLNTRVALLRKLHDALMDNQEGLAQLLTAEQGKPLAEARGEIAIGAAYIQWFAEEVRRTKGEIVPSPVNGRQLMVTHQPVGVVAAITPWNFPSSMLARKLGPALAVGCTTVVKPASLTPYSALAWGKLAQDVGYAPGVVNIITGSAREIGDTIMADPKVRKVTFTGSTEVGKELIRQSADTVKKVSMELGGNAPFIVFDDADLDRAVEGAMIAKYRNSGQTCVCANRIFVQSGIYDAFVERLVDATKALNVGDGRDSGVEQGPLVDQGAFDKVKSLVDNAAELGADVITGGKGHALGGTWFEPTVLSGITPNMKIASEEIFGPISTLFKFDTEEELLAAANDTEFGLAAYVYTQDMGRAFRMNSQLQYGLIGINEGLITTVEAPFGGLKSSGLGKEGGSQGIADYLDTKYVCIGGL